MMKSAVENHGSNWGRLRLIGWIAAGVILLLPLVAMQFTDEVQWDAADFVVAGVLLLTVGVLFEVTVRKNGNSAYRAAVAVALGAAFLLIWVNAAVGLIGSENNDINMMYAGVIAVGLIGAVVARFRPHGMALALLATALAQAAIAVVVLVAGWAPPESGSFEIITVHGFFVALFVASALLFRKASVTAAPPGLDG
jgi:hypothetical protein